eukprot:scaffold15703_cov566-Ochromonas_danica.AAC.1
MVLHGFGRMFVEWDALSEGVRLGLEQGLKKHKKVARRFFPAHPMSCAAHSEQVIPLQHFEWCGLHMAAAIGKCYESCLLGLEVMFKH